MTQRLENIGETVRRLEKEGFSTRDIIVSLQVERKLIHVDVEVARMDRQMLSFNEALTNLDTQMATTKRNLDILTAKKYTPDVERVINSWSEIESRRSTLNTLASQPRHTIVDLKKEINDIRKKIVNDNLPEDQVILLRQDLQKKTAEVAKQVADIIKKQAEIAKSTIQCNDVVTGPLKVDNIPHEAMVMGMGKS